MRVYLAGPMRGLPDVIEKFERGFVKTTDGSCWVWKFSLTRKGYGQFQGMEGFHRAHRVAYHLYIGDIPDGKLVCHSCDNRACVNPDHLFAGTADDNSKDMVSKGRSPKGGNNPFPKGNRYKAKLTDDQVRYIRSKYVRRSHKSSNARELAIELGVSKYCVVGVATGKTFKDVE